MNGTRIPLHRSLVGRLMATSLTVAVVAIVATAWLATQTTTGAIRQEQGRSLADDKNIYDVLVGYAATHKDWTGVGPVIAKQANAVGRRVTLTTVDREAIADSAPGSSLLNAVPSATVDPLRLDGRLTGGTDTIDPRAVGPFKLSAKEREDLRAQFGNQLKCMRAAGVEAQLVDGPDGRPQARAVGNDPKEAAGYCRAESTEPIVRSEVDALQQLARLAAPCLGVTDGETLYITRSFGVLGVADDGLRDARRAAAAAAKTRRCVTQARQVQLEPYVAKPALLFVTEPGNPAPDSAFTLSRGNVLRIVWVTAGVLLGVVLVTLLVGRRLVRPLRLLTATVGRPIAENGRIPVHGRDEIGHLARALNDLAERREVAEELRRNMVGDVAHELRTPLTNIRSWLEAAQDGLTPAGTQLLTLLHEEALLLQHVIDDLADLAAADAGTLRVHREQVYAHDLLAQVAEAHRGAAQAGGVELDIAFSGDPVVEADPVRFRQMIGNLVSNAIRYTPRDGRVTVSADATPAELTVSVTDTGSGIAPEDLPRIFDRFWRADTSRTRATGGSGLGLPIARQLAEAHGGTITAQSRLGEGTTMTIRLPR